MPAYCHDTRPPPPANPEEKEAPEPKPSEERETPEPKPIGIKAVAAAVRWHRADLAELMQLSDVMIQSMTGRR